MSWSELERLVDQAERDGALRRALMHCRSRWELVLASRRLGFAIDMGDLRQAWQVHQRHARGGRGRQGGSMRRSADRCG